MQELCLVPAGADPRAIAEAGGMPASMLINVMVEPGRIGFLMHGEGQTTFGTLPAETWIDPAAPGRCVTGGGFTLAFGRTEPLRGGRLVVPRTGSGGAGGGIEALPLDPLPR